MMVVRDMRQIAALEARREAAAAVRDGTTTSAAAQAGQINLSTAQVRTHTSATYNHA